MNIAKLIQERIRARATGVQVDGDVNAVVAANVGERGQVTKVTSTQRSSTSSGSARNETNGPKAA